MGLMFFYFCLIVLIILSLRVTFLYYLLFYYFKIGKFNLFRHKIYNKITFQSAGHNHWWRVQVDIALCQRDTNTKSWEHLSHLKGCQTHPKLPHSELRSDFPTITQSWLLRKTFPLGFLDTCLVSKKAEQGNFYVLCISTMTSAFVDISYLYCHN